MLQTKPEKKQPHVVNWTRISVCYFTGWCKIIYRPDKDLGQ